MSDPQNTDDVIDASPEAPVADSDGMPTTTQLEEPSTETDPDEEPKAPEGERAGDGEPTHEATGIGVID